MARACAARCGRSRATWDGSASTISREVHRNGGADRYRAARSDQAGWDLGAAPEALQAGLPSVR